MSNIHFIGGEKGGVGKSVVARLLSQYFLDNGQRYLGLDADQSHTTLSRFYRDFTRTIRLDDFSSTDEIIETAVEEDINVVIDLPAQSERFLETWLEESGVLSLCEEMNIGVVYWYTLDDGKDSLELLRRFLKRHGQRLHCVAVSNHGRGKHFDDTTTLAQDASLQGATLQAMSLPALHSDTMARIDELNFSFWAAQNIRGGELPHLTLMERQRVKIWINRVYSELDEIFASLEPVASQLNEVPIQADKETAPSESLAPQDH